MGVEEGRGVREGGKGGKEVSHRPPCSPDEPWKQIHFKFTPIFCEVVVFIWFEPAHPGVAAVTWLYRRKKNIIP